MSTSIERLAQLRSLRDPETALKLELLKIAQFQNASQRDKIKGDPGYTPKKGVDYFTQTEIQQIIQAIANISLRDGKPGDRGTDGAHGYSPRKGVDYFDGETPVRGIDYWTKEDVNHIISETVKRVPKQKAVTAQDVLEEFKKNPITMKDLGDYEDIKDLPQLIAFLKRGGFRGGGSGGTSGATSTPYKDTFTGSSGSTFSLTFTPKANTLQLIRGGAVQEEGTSYDYTISGVTITLATPLISGEALFAMYSY